MSIRVRTTYLAICDYPGCCLGHEFWELTEEHAIETVIDDDEWLCLFTGDNEPRFFCPLHLRHRPHSPSALPNVFYNSVIPDTQPTLHALNRFYEAMSTPQPLPKLACEDAILAVLISEDAK